VKGAAEEVLALSEKHRFPYCIHLVRHSMGWALAELGSPGEGVSVIRQGLAGMAEVGAGVSITGFLACLAEAYTLDGRIDAALSTIEDALNANPNELAYRPHLFTVRGALRLRMRDHELAKADFREALRCAESMSAKSYELRAATSLARLLAKEGASEEAHAMLTEIYDWFTEGFDTADLKDARLLLNDLTV
jgi:predicted ATPase